MGSCGHPEDSCLRAKHDSAEWLHPKHDSAELGSCHPAAEARLGGERVSMPSPFMAPPPWVLISPTGVAHVVKNADHLSTLHSRSAEVGIDQLSALRKLIGLEVDKKDGAPLRCRHRRRATCCVSTHLARLAAVRALTCRPPRQAPPHRRRLAPDGTPCGSAAQQRGARCAIHSAASGLRRAR